MMKPHFDVIPFDSKDSIITSLLKVEFGFIKDGYTVDNSHFIYIENYLRELGITTLIFEYNYTDKDYLEDYSHYYSKCLRNYEKECVRIHCFTCKFNGDDFINVLKGKSSDILSSKKLQETYGGFIIFRPLPLTLFGRTCLKTYPTLSAKEKHIRFFPIIREYKAHLFGIKLTVNSLAFQEQDKAVSACATSALWSAFQGTGILFHHNIPSPYQITAIATKNISPYITRSFPNKGLVPPQIASAIKKVGLNPLLVNIWKHIWLKAYLNAYLKAGIPIIMSIGIKEKNDDTDWVAIGLHAVTVTGYSIINGQPDSQQEKLDEEDSSIKLKSSSIKQLYVHDDRIGPFARISFLRDNTDDREELEITWDSFSNEKGKRKKNKNRLIPYTLFIPAYHKIRVPFLTIVDIIQFFTQQVYRLSVKDSQTPEIVWDIYLNTISTLKKRVLEEERYNEEEKYEVLIAQFPKYIWVADAYIDDTNKFSFYFDATDIETSTLFLTSIHTKEDNMQLKEKFILISSILIKNKENPRFKKMEWDFHCWDILKYYNKYSSSLDTFMPE